VLEALHLRWSDLFVGDDRRRARSPRALTEEDQARRDALAESRRQLARNDLELYAAADSIRISDGMVLDARMVATRLGPREDIWTLPDKAAELERLTRAAETELDAA